MIGFRRVSEAALAACLLLLGNLAPQAAAQPVEQAKVEAAITLQLLSFTEWPENQAPETETTIGVFGSDESYEAFQSLLEDDRYRRRFTVVNLDANPSEETLQSLHAIFFGERDPVANPRLIRRLNAQPIALVGAYEGFLEQGGLINLVKRQRRLSFEVHLGNSEARGIEYRAKLLRLAAEVYR